jgi:hypothetical protein
MTSAVLIAPPVCRTSINATTDGGRHWYDLIGPFPSVPNGETLDSAGDPALTFDREGTAYYASIDFNRTDDANGIWVNRSTNGGFTWSRGCVAIDPLEPAEPDRRHRTLRRARRSTDAG